MTPFAGWLRNPPIVLSALAILLCIGVVAERWFASANPQGEAGLFCDKVELKAVVNASGWVASGHNTVCSGFGGNSAVYIYVHPASQGERRDSLVLRYFEHGGSELPSIEWVERNELSIRVDRVSQITKILPDKSPIKIHYHIGQEDFPRAN